MTEQVIAALKQLIKTSTAMATAILTANKARAAYEEAVDNLQAALRKEKAGQK